MSASDGRRALHDESITLPAAAAEGIPAEDSPAEGSPEEGIPEEGSPEADI